MGEPGRCPALEREAAAAEEEERRPEKEHRLREEEEGVVAPWPVVRGLAQAEAEVEHHQPGPEVPQAQSSAEEAEPGTAVVGAGAETWPAQEPLAATSMAEAHTAGPVPAAALGAEVEAHAAAQEALSCA